MKIPLILALLVATWSVAMLAGWATTHDGPFNWRILLGPSAYYNWLDR